MKYEIQMRDIVDFCDRYNAIGYGDAEIIELKSCFIVKLYNGGFSENEELDAKLINRYPSCVVLDSHPIVILKLTKLNLKYNFHVVNFDNLEDYCSCYRKEKIFRHVLEIE